LDISGTGVTDISSLVQCKELNRIDIWRCPNIDVTVISSLSNLEIIGQPDYNSDSDYDD